MILRLILMRHAKSSWNHPSLGDHDRPLNARGRQSAALIGAWLKGQDVIPDQVLSSDSARTKETWQIMSDGFGTPSVQWEPDLYHASSATMLRVLQGATGQTVLMLGHNPGIASFAESLVKAPPDHMRFFDYPTAATTVIELSAIQWKDVSWQGGTVQAFIVPRDLMSG